MNIWPAVKNGDIKRIKSLLSEGIDVNLQNKNGYTVLMLASQYSNGSSSIETVKLLLSSKGISVNLQDKYGYTALMWASIFSGVSSSIETVKLLLDRGADPFVKDKRGYYTLDLCPATECKILISKYMWAKMKQTDTKMVEMLSQNNISKDVRELIVMRKRQQELCKNLSDERNKHILMLFAIEMNIPKVEGMTKAQLCNIISRVLTQGKYYDEQRTTK